MSSFYSSPANDENASYKMLLSSTATGEAIAQHQDQHKPATTLLSLSSSSSSAMPGNTSTSRRPFRTLNPNATPKAKGTTKTISSTKMKMTTTTTATTLSLQSSSSPSSCSIPTSSSTAQGTTMTKQHPTKVVRKTSSSFFRDMAVGIGSSSGEGRSQRAGIVRNPLNMKRTVHRHAGNALGEEPAEPTGVRLPIFREYERFHREDMWALKRANPVYESDEDDSENDGCINEGGAYESPLKRQRSDESHDATAAATDAFAAIDTSFNAGVDVDGVEGGATAGVDERDDTSQPRRFGGSGSLLVFSDERVTETDEGFVIRLI